MTDTSLPPISIEAMAAIGQDDERTDWILQPEKHISMLANPQKAGPLVRILERDEIAAISEAYRQADSQAIKAQKRYKLWGRIGIYATLAATLIGALFLLPIPGHWEELLSVPAFKGGAMLVQFTALAVAFFAAWWLQRQKYFSDWMHHRGAAEIWRIELFDKVMAADEPARAGELPCLPLQLEYFCRFQLNMQKRYYEVRGKEHAMGVKRYRGWWLFGWLLRLVFVILAVPALILLFDKLDWMGWLPLWGLAAESIRAVPLLGELAQWAEQSLLGIGVIASALHAAAAARSQLELDERNASRYRNTADNLAYLAATGLEPARISAARGGKDEVRAFVDAIQRQISSEHQEWVLLREITPDPVAGP